MNFYSKHSSPLFEKINYTIENILSSKTSSLSQQIYLCQKIVNELLKNQMMGQFNTFQSTKLLALQLVLLIAQNNDSSFHSVSYWENMMKSNQIVTYFASISNVLRAIQDILVNLQSEQNSRQSTTKIKRKQTKNQGRPQLLKSYRQQFSNMVQNLQSKFRYGSNSQTTGGPLNLEENQALIEQLQDLIEKKDIKINQMAQKTDIQNKQITQAQTLIERLQQTNAQYSRKILAIEMELNSLRIANQQGQLQKMELKQINRQLQEKYNHLIQRGYQAGNRNTCGFGGTLHTMSSLPGVTDTFRDTLENSKERVQMTSLKSFRRINNKEVIQKQIQKCQGEQNLYRMLYGQALTIQNLL